VNGVQSLGETGTQTPADSRLGVNGRCDTSSQDAGQACVFNDGTTIHEWTPIDDERHTRDIRALTLWSSCIVGNWCTQIHKGLPFLTQRKPKNSQKSGKSEKNSAQT
jgi:hypothetical protein